MAVAVTGACSSTHTTATGASAPPSEAATPTPSTTADPPLRLNAVDEDGSGKVPFGHRVSLRVTSGQANGVTARDDDGKIVKGSWNDRHTTWTSAAPIPSGETWTWSAKGASDKTAQGTIDATSAAHVARATANIGENRVVGIAAPIVVNFSSKVVNKADIERHLKVMIRPQGSHGAWKKAVGSWAWLPDNAPNSTVHFRTRHYWPAHTQVHVVLPLADLDWGNSTTGVQNLDWTFTIGRSQIVKADARKHNIVIYRNGKKVATYPASYGLDSQLNRNTRSGISIVTEKYKDIEMKSELFDYDLMEHWAVRINNNGEFIHANPETVQWQGKKNVSHGCINLSTPDAKAYFATAIYGDPVEVSGTRTKLSDSRTQLYDWALSWKQWKQLSALN